MSFILTLVRHGESEANVRHMLSGWLDVNLTDKGRRELEILRNTVKYPASEIYFSSPLKRCIETSHILFPDIEPIVRDDFREINFRSMEGWILSSKEEIDTYFESWVEDEPYIDEETISDVMARGSEAILRTVRECRDKGLHSATIVMHSGIMRSSVVALFNLDKSAFLEMSVPNGLGYILEFDDDLNPQSYKKLGED
ncbi:MAG: histidine phosphatase family protein [Spirochaetes bacterium]|uniref:Histidine phosphatase family protein n=1 Tax=Candidatus Ornithospirochaeta stercoravium TaxID=2840897 RepID=A0A9D9NDN0_9SPIO|nr:histidine phosphatase family protein [Candidatus Ornithospirochaeta stercoravium]